MAASHVSISCSVNTEAKPEFNTTCAVLHEVKNYILALVMRTYSLVILLAIIAMIIFLLPERLIFIKHTHRLFLILIDLDMYFVPIFFILIDKEMFQFTKKKIKDCYRSLVIKFDYVVEFF